MAVDEAQRVGPALPDHRKSRPAIDRPRYTFANDNQHCGKGDRHDRGTGPAPTQIALLEATLRGETAEPEQR